MVMVSSPRLHETSRALCGLFLDHPEGCSSAVARSLPGPTRHHSNGKPRRHKSPFWPAGVALYQPKVPKGRFIDVEWCRNPLLLARISNGGYAVTGLPIWYVCFLGGLGVRTSEKAEKRRANPSLIYQTRPNTMRAENNSRAVQSWKRMKQGHVSNMRGP